MHDLQSHLHLWFKYFASTFMQVSTLWQLMNDSSEWCTPYQLQSGKLVSTSDPLVWLDSWTLQSKTATPPHTEVLLALSSLLVFRKTGMGEKSEELVRHGCSLSSQLDHSPSWISRVLSGLRSVAHRHAHRPSVCRHAHAHDRYLRAYQRQQS